MSVINKYKKTILLSVFSFDARLDFQSGNVRCEIDYKDDDDFLDFLKKIPNDNFSNKELGIDLECPHVRLNKIAILENVKMKDLVATFGKIWYLEPLSTKYAKKDLLMDLDYALAKYDGFFNSASFIKKSEREELKKYLSINFISTDYDENYYGDGFFLYIKWIMGRHNDQKRHLLKMISHKDYGIMNHLPLASLMYPRSAVIDNEIEYLQGMLLNTKRCPLSQNEYLKFGFKIADSYEIKPKYQLENEENAISRCPLFNKDMGKIDLSKSLAHLQR